MAQDNTFRKTSIFRKDRLGEAWEHFLLLVHFCGSKMDFLHAFCGLWRADCGADFFAIRKNLCRQSLAHLVRSLVHLGQKKVSVAPDIF